MRSILLKQDDLKLTILKIVLFLLVTTHYGCKSGSGNLSTTDQNNSDLTTETKTMKRTMDPNSTTTHCQLIEKEVIRKNGEGTGRMQYYLRCSVQDYFIKFCESKVTREDVEKYLDKGISVEMEIREGEWDRCPGEPEMQSRVGTYVVINKVVN